jgi:rare lipoprotein A
MIRHVAGGLVALIAVAMPFGLARADPSVEEHGKASYYADKFEGRKTASGTPLDQNAMVAASRNLPLGATARVTNEATGKTVKVKVKDRGPYARGRVIDVSKRAAKALDMKKDGVAPVKVIARPADQPTPELKREVAQAAKDRRLARR